MKPYKFILPLILGVLSICATSCGDDGEDDVEPTVETSIVGVWQSNNYVISFSQAGFYSAYIADEFLDSGTYTRNGTTITCYNSYFGRTTTYVINSITDKSISVSVSYTDNNRKSKQTSLRLSKTSITPATMSNRIIGKNLKYLSSSFGTITLQFDTYNSGVKRCTKSSGAKYPLNFFYIYLDNKLYWQLIEDESVVVPTIGGWTTKYNNISCWELIFSNSGASIETFNEIF